MLPRVLTASLAVALLGTAPSPAPTAEPAAAAPHLVAATSTTGTMSSTASSTKSDISSRFQQALATSTARRISATVDIDGLGGVTRTSITTALPPASTEKLFTAATALRRLGPNYAFRTDLRSAGIQIGTVLNGDLYLVASGDPYFSSSQLDALAHGVAAAGIRTVHGHLRVDDSRYDLVRRGPGWKPEWVPEESGPLSAMALDGNAWRHDAAYLGDPATPVLGRLRAALSRYGVRVTTSDDHRARVPSSAARLASVTGGPMTAVLRRVLKGSDNFAAEQLLKEIGRHVRGAGTTAAGAAVVASTFGSSTVSDGSGLSSYDRQTTQHERDLLFAVTELEPLLPVGCKDGTLVHRFCGTVAAGRVYAKTGTLDTARALSGWTVTRDGHLVTFAILLSGFSSGATATKAIDRAVVVLAGSSVS